MDNKLTIIGNENSVFKSENKSSLKAAEEALNNS